MNNRVDIEMVNKGLVESREKAKALIMSGVVYVNNEKILKAGDKIKEGDSIEIRGQKLPFVSRGGLKLDKAIRVFDIDLKNLVCMDIGASTGGFTDCMLQNGASKVYAVDVGYGQLAWKLRNDVRIKSIEKINVKNCSFFDVYEKENMPQEELPEFMSMDLSFISIKKVLENCKNLIRNDATAVLLIKPQFEADRADIEKGGVVKDEKVRKKIIKDIETFCSSIGFKTLGVIESPIQGAKSKNTEYLIYLKREN